MPTQASSGPGPLIWVVILAAAVAGALWGILAAVGVFIGVTTLFVLIGVAIQKTQVSPEQKRRQQLRDDYRRRHGKDLPPLTDELREFFDRMTGRQSPPSHTGPAVPRERDPLQDRGPLSIGGAINSLRAPGADACARGESPGLAAPPSGSSKVLSIDSRCHWCGKGEILNVAPGPIAAFVAKVDRGTTGSWHNLVLEPVIKAWHGYRITSMRLVKPMADRLRPFQGDRTTLELNDVGLRLGVNAEGLGAHAELLNALLHSGTSTSLERLLLGRGWCGPGDAKTRAQRWHQVIGRLAADGVIKERDADLVSFCWFVWAQVFPMVQKTHREVLGHYILCDEPSRITICGRDLSGIAFPVMPLKRDNPFQAPVLDMVTLRQCVSRIDKEVRLSLERVDYSFDGKPKDVGGPISLDLRAVARHVDEMVWYSFMRPEVDRLLDLFGDPRFVGRIEALVPGAVSEMIVLWIAGLVVGRRLPGFERSADGATCECCL